MVEIIQIALGYGGFKMVGQALVEDLSAEECSSDPNSYRWWLMHRKAATKQFNNALVGLLGLTYADAFTFPLSSIHI